MKNNRKSDFKRIAHALASDLCLTSPSALLAEGDSLAILRKIPSQSISLILTDPPYHATKKKNIIGDTDFEEDHHYLNWMSEFSSEWRRILKPNGSLFCFCASEMAARLEVQFSHHFNVLSHIVWTKPNEPGFDGWKQKMKKENLRQWYAHTERIIFAEPASEGNLHRSPFANYLREVRIAAGISAHRLAELTGAYGKVNHGGAVSNWETGRNIPSRAQYDRIVSAILKTGKIKSMLSYNDAIRPFMVNASKEFTDVWTFPSVRPFKGKHPAEKPSALLEHAIEATTYPGDIVLDCFAGSGTTGLAAIKLGRLSVAIEIDPTWIERIGNRLNWALSEKPVASIIKRQATSAPAHEENRQLGLVLG